LVFSYNYYSKKSQNLNNNKLNKKQNALHTAENGENMKTLYITDLDGTLLDSTPNTSEYTNKVLNELLKKDMVISVATARSLTSARLVTKGLEHKYPVVVHNGTFIVDPKNGEILHKNVFSQKQAHSILDDLLSNGLCPVVFSLLNGEQKFSYIRETANNATIDFLDERENDIRNRRCYDKKELYDGEIYYFTLVGDDGNLLSLYDKYKDTYHCIYHIDMYSNEYWLEIMPKDATKSTSVLKLKEMLGCDKIVCFGDGTNDIDMFDIADECYAVENAVQELKDKATQIIDSNCNDGVAKWLFLRYNNDV